MKSDPDAAGPSGGAAAVRSETPDSTNPAGREQQQAQLQQQQQQAYQQQQQQHEIAVKELKDSIEELNKAKAKDAEQIKELKGQVRISFYFVNLL